MAAAQSSSPVRRCSIDIGGTKLAAAVIDRDGSLLASDRAATVDAATGDELFAALERLCRGVLEQSGRDVVAVGVGCGGPMRYPAGVVSPLNIPVWNEFPLREKLADAFKRPAIVITTPSTGAGRVPARGQKGSTIRRGWSSRRGKAALSSVAQPCMATAVTLGTSGTSSSGRAGRGAVAGRADASKVWRRARGWRADSGSRSTREPRRPFSAVQTRSRSPMPRGLAMRSRRSCSVRPERGLVEASPRRRRCSTWSWS